MPFATFILRKNMQLIEMNKNSVQPDKQQGTKSFLSTFALHVYYLTSVCCPHNVRGRQEYARLNRLEMLLVG